MSFLLRSSGTSVIDADALLGDRNDRGLCRRQVLATAILSGPPHGVILCGRF